MHFRRSILSLVLCPLLMVMLAGCASYPPPKARVPFWQHPQFNNDNPPQNVKIALAHGDQYRNLVASGLGDKTPIGKAKVYWYVEEGRKFYQHVLDQLEPNNAYAAVCMGHMYLMRARVAPEKNKTVQLSLAHNALQDAEEKRKGYADTHRFYGELYALQGEWLKAEAEFAKLVDSGFKDSHIYAWWGYVLKKQQKGGEAKEFFRKAVESGYPEQCAMWARKQM